MIKIMLNPAIRDNFAFTCIEAPLSVNRLNPVGYTSKISKSIIRGLKAHKLIDVDGVIDIETGELKQLIKNETLIIEETIEETVVEIHPTEHVEEIVEEVIENGDLQAESKEKNEETQVKTKANKSRKTSSKTDVK